MTRVLIAWELGEAFGHIARCLQLAQNFVARGYKVTLVLKDIRLPTEQITALGITVLPAPLTPYTRANRSPQINYADVLRANGFAASSDVTVRLTAWQRIFSSIQPSVLVADHAPTALLAARLADIPYLSIGNGFAIPPDVFPWPSIRPWEAVSKRALSTAEHRLDHVVATAQKALGHSRAVRMRDLFGARDILDTFAELDHYGPRPNRCYVGPIISLPQTMRIAWQNKKAPHVLAYLRPSLPGFRAILQALNRLDAEVLCVVPGMYPEAAKRFATKRLRIALAPIDLPPLLENTDLVLGYGNSAFSTQALLAGAPLLMRPRYIEQALFAHRVEILGAGQLLNGQIEADTVKTSLQELLSQPVYRQAASTFQSRYADFSPNHAIEQSLLIIERRFFHR